MKKLLKYLSIVFMVAVLTGCAKQQIHMNVTNSDVTIEVTDVMNSSLRDEEEVASLKKQYEELGYEVREYDGSEDGMVGIVYSKKYKLSEVSGSEDVVFHLETIGTENFKDPKFFKVKKGLLGNTYTANLVLDTSVYLDLDEGETEEEYEEEISEYASYIDISYTVTLPSKAKSHNADSVDGKTYTWNVEYGKKIDINYEFTTTSPIVYVVIVGAAVAIIAAVVLAILKKKNKNVPTIPENNEVVTPVVPNNQ